jgi:hypothetical protein
MKRNSTDHAAQHKFRLISVAAKKNLHSKNISQIHFKCKQTLNSLYLRVYGQSPVQGSHGCHLQKALAPDPLQSVHVALLTESLASTRILLTKVSIHRLIMLDCLAEIV